MKKTGIEKWLVKEKGGSRSGFYSSGRFLYVHKKEVGEWRYDIAYINPTQIPFKYLLVLLEYGDVVFDKTRLLELEKELLMYCHDSNCNDLRGCPATHYDCSNILDLDTALAWSVAKKLNWLIYSWRIDKNILEETKTIVEIIYTCLDATSKHDDYYKLYMMFNEVVTTICRMEFRPKERR